ncbi:MAG: ribonuclease HI family protein [Candidatus Pacebacteria bacterium]|nr:ribonuclease HI family protein [Candidatus Paceibacterota bacterium]
MELKIFTDGGSRGNPGIAGGGVVVYHQDQVIFEQATFWGQKTNNESEYLAFLAALDWLSNFSANNKLEKVAFFLDSKLVVEQINKKWQIKEPRLKEFAQQAWQKISALPCSITVTHILRKDNAQADALANQAMDTADENQ